MHSLVTCLAGSALLLFIATAGRAEDVPGKRVTQASFVNEAVTLRLVAETPDADGAIRAALLVDLAPGWKTYWIDPGEAGIPPRIDLSESRNAEPSAVAFPPPHRFGDEYGMSNGYSKPLAVALRLRQSRSGEATEIRASVTIGVCQQICVPISAELATRPKEDVAGSDAVAVAFSALPKPSDAENGVDSAALSSDGRTLDVAARFAAGKAGPDPDLFLAGPKGWHFGKPSAFRREGTLVRFTVPVLEKPRKASAGPLTVDAVITSGQHSIETKGVAVVSVSAPTAVPGG